MTGPDGTIHRVLWFDEGSFEASKELALRRAFQLCESYGTEVNFLVKDPVLPRSLYDWRMLVASGPPYRLELFGQPKTL